MQCLKCKSDKLHYNGFGLTCEDCSYVFTNIDEVKALEIAFKRKSKQTISCMHKNKIKQFQAQAKKPYFRFRYFEVE